MTRTEICPYKDKKDIFDVISPYKEKRTKIGRPAVLGDAFLVRKVIFQASKLWGQGRESRTFLTSLCATELEMQDEILDGRRNYRNCTTE